MLRPRDRVMLKVHLPKAGLAAGSRGEVLCVIPDDELAQVEFLTRNGLEAVIIDLPAAQLRLVARSESGAERKVA